MVAGFDRSAGNLEIRQDNRYISLFRTSFSDCSLFSYYFSIIGIVISDYEVFIASGERIR